jgi:hypothetical protein
MGEKVRGSFRPGMMPTLQRLPAPRSGRIATGGSIARRSRIRVGGTGFGAGRFSTIVNTEPTPNILS